MINENDLRQAILELGKLEIAIEDIQSMSHDDYALARKNYFGASDSSILCGVNLYKTLDELLKEKNNKFITDEERKIGEKPIVKKGYDLEPIILDKAEQELNALGHKGLLYKPRDMFRFVDTDGLSVNYDGVLVEEDKPLIPVEAKLVSRYGEKYYNKQITHEQAKALDVSVEGSNLEQHIKRKALKLGIPPYYYTQVQQEISGLDAPYGYLAAMFDDSWSFKLYYIPRDNYVIDVIKNRCVENINKIKRDTI